LSQLLLLHEDRRANLTHYHALAHNYSILRCKIFDHAGSRWECVNVTLKADLIHLTKKWADLVKSNFEEDDSEVPESSITFAEDEIDESMRLHVEQVEADDQLQACRDAIGAVSEGWVPVEQYDEIKECARKLRAAAFKACEIEEERALLSEHYVLDDFDESKYD
jgi:hypothetical protein